MMSVYEFETRMNQLKHETEKAAREAWMTASKRPRRRLAVLMITKALLLRLAGLFR